MLKVIRYMPMFNDYSKQSTQMMINYGLCIYNMFDKKIISISSPPHVQIIYSLFNFFYTKIHKYLVTVISILLAHRIIIVHELFKQICILLRVNIFFAKIIQQTISQLNICINSFHIL